jgi:hypothetical protein
MQPIAQINAFQYYYTIIVDELGILSSKKTVGVLRSTQLNKKNND